MQQQDQHSFLYRVADDIYREHGDQIHQLCIVLPSRRAALFLKKEMAKVIDKHVWLPEILSIEEFVEKLSGYKVIDQLPLLFEFYDAYCRVSGNKAESFDLFSKWAQILLQDFNEIDRYRVDTKFLFNYIEEAKKLESWGLEPNEEPKGLVKNYLGFWKLLAAYYYQLKKQLEQKSRAYQGMAYRKVADTIDTIINEWDKTPWKQVYFAGLNALNRSEEHIIHQLLKADLANIYWDSDNYYLLNPKHEAGYFLRRYQKKWKQFGERNKRIDHEYFTKEKKIEFIGAPKNIGQAKLTGQLLEDWISEETDLTKTAVVLADEELLLPVLHSLPAQLDKVNVTMGLPLRNIPMAALFELILNLHENAIKFHKTGQASGYRFYYRDINKILRHPYIQSLLGDIADAVVYKIETENRVFSQVKQFQELFDEESFEKIAPIFSFWKQDATEIIGHLKAVVEQLRHHFFTNDTAHQIELEYLFYFAKLFNQLDLLVEEYPFVKNLATFHSIYKQLLSGASLPFYGEPLQGLQLMGMLETRAIDFENIILLSANEGILPAGKTNNSLIPTDIKLECGMPVYSDKDAIYAYHFYRLLQRSKRTIIAYNTETDTFGSGEKSRFLTQLETELPPYAGEKLQLKKSLLKTLSDSQNSQKSSVIAKSPEVMKRLKVIAEKGFSPSALNVYKNCKLQFYFEKVLGIKESDEVEETIAANTLGTVVHKCLEDFYTPYVGKELRAEHLEKMKKNVDQKLQEIFKEIYQYGDLSHGKNLLIVTVAKRFILNFLDKEQEQLQAIYQQSGQLKIIKLEEKLRSYIHSEKIPFKVKIHGDADRIDEVNGFHRIIDYKTGKVNDDELRVKDITDITTDNKLGKSFQLLMYAYMYQQMQPEIEEMNSANISFRDLRKNWLKKVQVNGDKKGLIDKNILSDFETELSHLIEEIFDESVPFEHQDRTEPCRFCDPEAFL